jgi:hypothetical protein
MAAGEKAVQVIDKLRGLRLTRAAELVEETLAYYAFPEEHWRRIRTRYETIHTNRAAPKPRAPAVVRL